MCHSDGEHKLCSKTFGNQCESSVLAVGEEGGALGPEKTSMNMREAKIMQ